MPTIPIREAAYLRIVTALATTGVTVDRNRRAPLTPAEFPRLVLRDGAHAATQDTDPGMVVYVLGVTVEGYVKATEANMGQALSDLHAKVVTALVGQSLTYGSPAIDLWLTETRMEPEMATLAASEATLGNFVAEFECELRSSFATGPYVTVP